MTLLRIDFTIRGSGDSVPQNKIKITVKMFGGFIYSFYICIVNQNIKEMNQINEMIDVKEASCREMYIPDLMEIFNSQRMTYWSWGVDNTKNTVDNVKRPKMYRMKVSGHHHKGHVYIFLNGMDLFDVYLTTLEGKIKDRTDEMGLYFDQLVEWIDDRVERIPEYTR
jgi:hypothetical protein